jgi:hypothetical protein
MKVDSTRVEESNLRELLRIEGPALASWTAETSNLGALVNAAIVSPD